MSLVGPRPEIPTLVEHYQPWQRKRFVVPQGITGWTTDKQHCDIIMLSQVVAQAFYHCDLSKLSDQGFLPL